MRISAVRGRLGRMNGGRMVKLTDHIPLRFLMMLMRWWVDGR